MIQRHFAAPQWLPAKDHTADHLKTQMISSANTEKSWHRAVRRGEAIAGQIPDKLLIWGCSFVRVGWDLGAAYWGYMFFSLLFPRYNIS